MINLVRYAWFVLVFNIGVVLMGAMVRASGSGAGCGPSWPTCHGELIPELRGATAIEFAHRAVSGVALVLVIVLAVAVWRATEGGHPARTGAILGVIAIVVEALIGAAIVLAEWVADDASVARAVAVPLHLVNTLFLLAALTMTVFWLSGGGRLDLRADKRVTRLILLGALALVAIAATGAVTALADTLFPKSGTGLETSSNFLTRVRVVHPALAVASAMAGWVAAKRAGLSERAGVGLLPILVGVMLLSGVANVLMRTPIPMQLIHLALADVLWVTYVWVSAGALSGVSVAP